MFVKALLFTPLAYIIRLASLVLAPVAVLTLNSEGRPWWVFRWIETHDDIGWNGPLTERPTREKTEKYGRRVGMMFWWWRNQAYSAQYHLFSIPIDAEYTDVKLWGQLRRPERGLWWAYVTVKANGKPYFEFRVGWVFSAVTIYVRVGWKVVPIAQGKKAKGSTGMFTGFTPRTDG